MHNCTEVTLSENSKNKCAQKEVDTNVVVAVNRLTQAVILRLKKGHLLLFRL